MPKNNNQNSLYPKFVVQLLFSLTFNENIYFTAKYLNRIVKGQLISKCLFGVIDSTKIPTKKFDNFCPRNLKRGKSLDKGTL